MFHNLYICSCITCCLIVYNYLYYHALCGAFSEIKSFKFQKSYYSNRNNVIAYSTPTATTLYKNYYKQ